MAQFIFKHKLILCLEILALMTTSNRYGIDSIIFMMMRLRSGANPLVTFVVCSRSCWKSKSTDGLISWHCPITYGATHQCLPRPCSTKTMTFLMDWKLHTCSRRENHNSPKFIWFHSVNQIKIQTSLSVRFSDDGRHLSESPALWSLVFLIVWEATSAMPVDVARCLTRCCPENMGFLTLCELESTLYRNDLSWIHFQPFHFPQTCYNATNYWKSYFNNFYDSFYLTDALSLSLC